jgi:hypothetical protein
LFNIYFFIISTTVRFNIIFTREFIFCFFLFSAISAIAIISAVGFAVAIAFPMVPYITDFYLGVCFFVASSFALVAYFGPKIYLLMTGADLNRQFKIVRKRGVASVSLNNAGESSISPGIGDLAAAAGTSGATPTESTRLGGSDDILKKSVIATYLPVRPLTQEHCRILIEHMQGRLMALDMQFVNGDASRIASQSSKNRKNDFNKLHIQSISELKEDSVIFLAPQSSQSVKTSPTYSARQNV